MSALLEVRVSWGRLREPFEEPILPEIRPDAVACPDLRGDVAFDSTTWIPDEPVPMTPTR